MSFFDSIEKYIGNNYKFLNRTNRDLLKFSAVTISSALASIYILNLLTKATIPLMSSMLNASSSGFGNFIIDIASNLMLCSKSVLNSATYLAK